VLIVLFTEAQSPTGNSTAQLYSIVTTIRALL